MPSRRASSDTIPQRRARRRWSLVKAESAAYNWRAGLKPQISSATHHQSCRDHGSVCYGPKILITLVVRKTVVGQIDGVPHKPL